MAHPRTTSYAIVLLALTIVAGGAFAWMQYRELVRLRADSQLNDSTRADLQKRLWALEKRKNELDAEVASLRARGPADRLAEGDGDPPPDGPLGAARPGPGRFSRRGSFNGLSTLMDNPAFNKLWMAQQKLALDARYSALFKNLNLSPTDLDKFKSLLVDKQTSLMDVMAAARDQGLNPRNPEDRSQIAALVQTAQAQANTTIQQALGDAAYAQYQNYEQTLPQRTVVSQLAQSLSYTGNPLQDSQAEQLVNILAANAPARAQSNAGGGLGAAFMAMGGGGPGGFGNRGSTITDAAVTQAQSVLTAPQVAALQQLQAQQQAQQQMAQMLRQTFNGGGSPSAGSQGQAGTPPSPPPKPPGG